MCLKSSLEDSVFQVSRRSIRPCLLAAGMQIFCFFGEPEAAQTTLLYSQLADKERQMSRLLGIVLLCSAVLLAEPIWASDLVISEVMAHPEQAAAQAFSNEYIEICNIGETAIDLGSCMLATPGGVRQKLIPWNGGASGIPAGRILAPGAIALITPPSYTCPHQAWFASLPHPAGRIHLTIEGSRLGGHGLPDSGGAIFLEDARGKLLDVFAWYEDAGENTSWERTNPADKTAPLRRSHHGGTPGSAALLDSLASPAGHALTLKQPEGSTPAFAILRLALAEKASLSLHTLDGRLVRLILEQAMGPGVWRVPIFSQLEDGRQLPAGRYVVSAKITTSSGGQTHVSRILRLAPRRH